MTPESSTRYAGQVYQKIIGICEVIERRMCNNVTDKSIGFDGGQYLLISQLDYARNYSFFGCLIAHVLWYAY